MYGAYYQPHPASRTSTSSSSTNTSDGSQGGRLGLMSLSSQALAGQGDVPGAVRNLLISSKRLPTLLTRWSRGTASESDVSDVYVQIGTDFNAALQAFAYYRIDLSDIHSVPGELRTVLEQCLAEDPSPEVLAAFMPDVRAVLVKLLRGLQARQDAWHRARSGAADDYR